MAITIITHESQMLPSYEVYHNYVVITKAGQKYYYINGNRSRLITADEWFESLSEEDKADALNKEDLWR